MKMDTTKYKSIDEYIALQPEEIKGKLTAIRAVLKEVVPDAQEVISYNMPALKLNGILVYYAAAKNHIGFYPTGSGITAFAEKLKEYDFSKGTVRFPINSPLPLKLIADITRYRYNENLIKSKAKNKK